MHNYKMLILAALAPLALVACGGAKAGTACTVAEPSARPSVLLEWEIAHGSMDDDPPRPTVTLVVKGPTESRLALGEFLGICRLVDLGAPPDDPVEGAGVSELSCEHQGVAMRARVVHAKGAVVVRRYERGGAEMKNVREIGRLDVPSCAHFSSELAQQGTL
jgi:hypothetical protein